jgi:two-component system phosphate regulon sensor histidine kinase PhoR
LLVVLVGLKLTRLWNGTFAASDAHCRRMTAAVESFVVSTRTMLTTLSSMPEIKQGKPATQHAVLAAVLATNPLYDSLLIVDGDGWSRSSTARPLGQDLYLGDRDYVVHTLAGGPAVFRSLPGTRLRPGQFTTVVAVPVLDDQGRPVSTLAATFKSFSILDLLSRPQALPGAVAVVTDDQGRIIAQSGLVESWIGRQAADVGPWRSDGNEYGLSRSVDGRLRIADAAGVSSAPWIVLTAVPVGQAFSEVIGMVGVELLIALAGTAALVSLALNLRASAREIETREGTLAAILNSLREGVTMIDAAGRVLFRNQNAEQITGLANEEAATLDDFRQLTPGHSGPIPQLARWLWQAAAHGSMDPDFEYELTRPGGDSAYVSLSAAPVLNSSGQAEGIVIITRDLTRMRDLELAKQRFLQVLAHELRNRLAVATGAVQLARLRTGAGDEQGSPLRTVEEQLWRLADLMGDLVTADQVSEGRLRINPVPTDVAELLRSWYAHNSVLAQDKATSLDVQDARIPVVADPERLAQVFTNLLGNAVKYSQPGSSIRIAAGIEGDEALITFTDQGIGVPEDQLEQIFAGFFRADNATRWKPEGLGLGLYISRSIVLAHGGAIWAQNRPEGGTVVSLRLPLETKGTAPGRIQPR